MKTHFLRTAIMLILALALYSPELYSQTFETTVVATETANRPSIFADSLGYLHIAWDAGDTISYANNQSGGWNFSRRAIGSLNDLHFTPVIVADKYGFAYISYRYMKSGPFSIRYVTNKNLTSYNWSMTSVMSGGHFHESSIEVGSDQAVHIFAQEDELDPSASRIFYNNFALADTAFKDNIVQYYSTSIDQNDDLHIVGYRGDHIFYKKYSSSSWSTPVIIDQVGISAYQPSISTDKSGKQHVAFSTSSGIYYLNNTSGSWSTPVLISSTAGGVFPDVVVDENGKAFIAYYTSGSSGDLFFTTNHGGSWITPKFIADIGGVSITDATQADSKIALDLKNSTVNLAYVENTNEITLATTDDYELRSSKSTDLTSTLTSTAGTPTIDTLTTMDASSTQTLLQFTITDVANDGQGTKVESIIFERGPGMSSDVCFNDLFASMTIEEVGESSEAVTLYSSRARIGTQGSTWMTIAEGGSKSFILKGVLNSSLSSILNKDFQIKVNGLQDVIVDYSGSLFSYSSTDIISDTLRIQEHVLSGSGTEGDPYLISSLNDLKAVSEASTYWNDYLKQTVNIDASGTSTWNSNTGFSPIGNTTTAFTGSYDGNSKTISGLYINQTWGMNQGMFGNTSSATIQNLGLISLNITSYLNTGGLVGSSLNSTINYCYTKGSITGNGTTGGLCGSFNGGSISNSYSTASVSGATYTGGLVGTMLNSSSITNSYSTGSISASSTPTGGLIGTKNTGPTATNSFWDTTTSGQSSSDLGTGKTTAQMKDEDTFSDTSTEGLSTAWDFVGNPNNDSGSNNYWSIDGSNNSGYPWLTWEGHSVAANTWDGSESTDFMDKDNWSLGFVPNVLNNITVNSGGNQPLIGASQSITINNLTVNSGASLTIDSDASNCGSLIVNETSSGNVTYQLYLTGGTKWHLIVPPVSGQSINDFVTNGSNAIATNDDKYGLGYYNESNDTWTNFTTTTAPSAGNMQVCTGFEILRTSDGKVSITGTATCSETGTSIEKASNGWNLIGNPFPSAVYLNSNADGTNNFLTYNTDVLDASFVSIYLWNPATSQFEIVNQSSGATYIPPCQAFFVKSKDVEGTVSFPITHRTHQTGAGFKSAETTNPEIKISVGNENGNHSTLVRYIQGTTLGLDPGYDAGMYGASNDEIKLYSRLLEEHEVKFGLQCLPDNNYENMIIPLGLEVAYNTEIKFTAEAKNLPEGYKVYLEDNTNESYTNLSEEDAFINIHLEAGTYEDRFYIHTKRENTSITENDELDDDPILIPNYKTNSIIYLGELFANAEIMIIDLSGRTVHQAKINTNEIKIPKLSKGIYIVWLINGKNSVSQKINWM